MAGRFPDAFLDQLRQALPVLEVVSRRYKMRKAGSAEHCAIDDQSLTVNTTKNMWYDHGKGQTGGDIFAFEMFATGCPFQEAVENLAKIAGLPLPKGYGATPRVAKTNGRDGPVDPDPPPSDGDERHGAERLGDDRRRDARRGGTSAPSAKRTITAVYDYLDADELLLYQVCRQEWVGNDGKRKKTFLQRRPHGVIAARREDQSWVWGLGAGVFVRGRDGNFYAANEERLKWEGAERIEITEPSPHGLYRFPQLREEMAQTEADRRIIFVVEGEKDAETLAGWDCVATTNSGGAGNWRPEHAEEMRGADVVVLLDNDQAGRARGHAIALSLRGVAARVRALSWPDHWRACPDGGDVTDWRDKGGGTIDALFEIVDKLPPWSPAMPETKFGAVRYADIDKHSAALQWTIKGILQKASVSLWYGAPSSGKSFLLTDAALSIARGIPWMGYRTRPGLVIYQTGEGGVGFRLRLKAYREHEKIVPGDDIPFVYLPTRINLFTADADVDKMIEEIRAWASFYDNPLELVVIDTFNAASGGANENANQDVGKVLDRCRKIADATGAHVAVVHHTPAAGGKPRGHSSLVGDVETTMAIEQTESGVDKEVRPDGTVISRSVRSWHLTKQKDGPSGISRSFVLKQVKLGVDEDGDALSSCVVSSLHTAAIAAQRVVPEGWAQLNPANEDVFRSLVRAINKKGRDAPPELGAPRGEQCVTVGDWQAEMLELVVGHEEITDTVRNRIKLKVWRAQKHWLPDKVNLVVKKGEWVWRTERRVHMVDTPPRALRPEPEAPLDPGDDGEQLPF